MDEIMIERKTTLQKTFPRMNKAFWQILIVGIVLLLIFISNITVFATSTSDYVLKDITLTDNKDLEFILTTPYTNQGTIPDSFNIFLDDFKINGIWYSTFEKESTPLTILFLVDLSEKWDQIENDRAANIIKEFLRDPRILKRSKIGIMTFGEKIEPLLEYTNDKDAIISAADSLTFSKSEINYPLALLNAIKYMSATVAGNENEQKHIVLISDGTGYDEALINEEEMAKSLSESNVTLSAVVQKNDTDGNINSLDFNRIFQLAKKSGGYAVSPIANNELNRDLAKVLVETIKFGMIIHTKTPDEFEPNTNNTYNLVMTMYQNWGPVIGVITEQIQPVVITTAQSQPTQVVDIPEENY